MSRTLPLALPAALLALVSLAAVPFAQNSEPGSSDSGTESAAPTEPWVQSSTEGEPSEPEPQADGADEEGAEAAPASSDPGTEAASEIIPLAVLAAELRPMRLAQVEEELEIWLGHLQEKCVEVSQIEVDALEMEETDDDEALAELTERAVELRAERGHLIERVEEVIAAFEEKGGDVAEARSYVESVIVTPPVSGWRSAWTTARAWLVSGDGGLALAQNIAVALGLVIVAWLLSKIVGRIVQRLLSKTHRVSELLRAFVVTSAQRVVLFFGILLALSKLGLNMGPLLAAIGALGLVLGLALQGTISNFASGLMIMIYRPFDVGDVVNAAGTLGTVKGMTLVTTTIRTFDNQRISVPNNMIWGDVITNVTAEKTRRVDMVFGIGYDDDVAKAKQVLLDIVSGHEKVLKDPAPIVEVSELADSSVNFVVRPWVHTEQYWDVYWDLTQLVKERFDAEGISIPFPQRDLHVYHSGDAAPVLAPQADEPHKVLRPRRPATHEPAPAGDDADSN